jgi:hypothetical protein
MKAPEFELVLNGVAAAATGTVKNPAGRKFVSWQYWVTGSPTAVAIALWVKLHKNAPYVRLGDVQTDPIYSNSGYAAGASSQDTDGLLLGASPYPVLDAMIKLDSITGGTNPKVYAVLAFHD